MRDELMETLSWALEGLSPATLIPAGVISAIGFCLYCGLWLIF